MPSKALPSKAFPGSVAGAGGLSRTQLRAQTVPKLPNLCLCTDLSTGGCVCSSHQAFFPLKFLQLAGSEQPGRDAELGWRNSSGGSSGAPSTAKHCCLQGVCSANSPPGLGAGGNRYMLAAWEICFYILNQKHAMKNSYFGSDLIFGSRSEKKS